MEAMSKTHTTFFYSKGSHSAQLHACRWPYQDLYLSLSLFYGLLLFTCLSLGSQSRWCGNEDRYAVYTEGEGVEFYITDLKTKYIKVFISFSFKYEVYHHLKCHMYCLHIDWQHGRFCYVGSVPIFSCAYYVRAIRHQSLR